MQWEKFTYNEEKEITDNYERLRPEETRNLQKLKIIISFLQICRLDDEIHTEGEM